MFDLFELEPEKYYDVPSSQPKAKKDNFIKEVVESDRYVCSEKFDGNWARFVVQSGVAKIQSRGRGVSGDFGEFQDKVPHIFSELTKQFTKDTLIIGELYLPNGNDKDVGSILRCLTPKALDRQTKGPKLQFKIFDVWYLNGESLMDMELWDRIVGPMNSLKYIFKNSKYIQVVDYCPGSKAYDLLEEVFAHGGEGIVIQDGRGVPEPGKRPAWKSLKIKKEIFQTLDVFCIGYDVGVRLYTGDHIEDWLYWENVKSGEKFNEHLHQQYVHGETLEPVTKNYFYGWPTSICCGVWRDGVVFELCKVSGLTEELKKEIKENPKKYLNMPLRIIGMEFSTNQKNNDISIRHPRFVGFREDISNTDCTYDKIFG